VSFSDALEDAVARVGNPCLLGLDPHLDLLPDEFAVARDPNATRQKRAQALAEFCWGLLDVCEGKVACVKPQSAFFEVFGADGIDAWESVVTRAHEADLLVIGDVKRSDIASTAAAYATAFLTGVPGGDDVSLCDAITINPYLGDDSVQPFVDACKTAGKGVFVLVRTSNKGGARFQLAGDPPLAHRVADAVAEWGADLVGTSGWSSVGAVVGATHPDELAAFRERMPRTPFLLPGYGAQGAGADDVLGAFPGPGISGGLINSSRGIAFAYRKDEHRGKHWKDAARDALDAMIADVGGAFERRTSAGRA